MSIGVVAPYKKSYDISEVIMKREELIALYNEFEYDSSGKLAEYRKIIDSARDHFDGVLAEINHKYSENAALIGDKLDSFYVENETAIREILKFYDAYICKLCLRPFYHSESGKITMQVDEELKGQIHTEMMKAILKFEIRVK